MTKTTVRARSSDFASKRADLTKRIAGALLKAGVAQIPLRDLASELGTSDRMLLYYFKSKGTLVNASLGEVSGRLTTILADGLSTARMHPAKLLEKTVPLFASSAVAPFMTVWADISARGSRGEEPFRSFARSSIEWWLDWLDKRLDVGRSESRRDVAAAVLTILEGARLLDGSVTGGSKGAVKVLSRALAAQCATASAVRS